MRVSSLVSRRRAAVVPSTHSTDDSYVHGELVGRMDLDGNPRDPVYCIDGLTLFGHTWYDTAAALNARYGSRVRVEGIAGHERGFQDFFGIDSARRWIDEQSERYLDFVGDHPGTIIAHSASALIAMIVAVSHPEKVRRLVTMAPAVKLSNRGYRIGLQCSRIAYRVLPGSICEWSKGNVLLKSDRIKCPDDLMTDALRLQPRYTAMPLVVLTKLVELQRIARRMSPRIGDNRDCRVLVLHGGRDETIHPDTSKKIVRRWFNPDRTELRIYEKSPHTATLGEEGPTIVNDIVDWYGRGMTAVAAA